ncbi:MAG: Phosphoserine phosphatase RsbU, partial [Bacteroidota bacterium]
MRLYRILLWVLFLLLHQITSAQQYNFRRYSIEENLPRSGVYSVFEDSRGYLWIATEGGGVAMFDGRNFQVFTTQDGLCSNSILQVYEDSQHSLWFASEDNGVSRYDGAFFFTINKDNGLSSNVVRCIIEDKYHNLLLATEGGGINKFSLFNIRTNTNPIIAPVEISQIRRKNGLPHDVVRVMTTDKNGTIWIGTDFGLAALYNDRLICYGTAEGLPHKLILSLYPDTEGNLWIGTEKGVSKFDGLSFTNFDKEKGLIDNRISSITQDQEHNLWFGTLEGISLYDGKSFTNFTEREGLSNNRIRSLFSDSFGNLWISTYFGGIMKYSGNLFTAFTDRDGLPNNQITALEHDTIGRIWLGSWEGLATIDARKAKPIVAPVPMGISGSRIVYSLFRDSLERMWIGTSDGIEIFSTGTTPKFIKKLDYPGVRVIATTNPHNLWLGTQNGLTHLEFEDFNTLRITKTNTYSIADGMNGEDISDIAIDKSGNLWIGFIDGGLTVYSGSHYLSLPSFTNLKNIVSIVAKADKVLVGTKNAGLYIYKINPDGSVSDTPTHYNKQNGLYSDQISLMLFDQHNNLWVGAKNGIEQITLSPELSVKHFGFQEGFSGIETLDNSSTIDNQGNIWFGTVKGAIRLNSETNLNDTIESRLLLTDIKLGYKTVNWQEISFVKGIQPWSNVPIGLDLPYDERSITFEFRGLSYRHPEKVQYKWMLEGFDAEWSPPSTINHVTYGNLPSGQYIFHVLSSNGDGEWNTKPVDYTFSVKKPFWHTITFYLILSGSITLMFIIGYQIQLQRLARDKRELETEVGIRTLELKKEKEITLKRKTQIENKNILLDQRNKEITSSLQYAHLIQSAILENETILSEHYPNSFIIYQPKDIVSGDFYWFRAADGAVYLAAADGTGHGVPGAFISIVGHNALENVINQNPEASPSQILNQVSQIIHQTLNRSADENKQFDGIDMALCKITGSQIEYAGAMRPLIIVRKNATEFEKVIANRLTLGVDITPEGYQNHKIQLDSGDRIFLFSDGFPDQFGGQHG